MALLNYLSHENLGNNTIASIRDLNDNKFKLILVQDAVDHTGHLLSHGIDLTPDYSIKGSRGLVPATTKNKAYFGVNGWEDFWSKDVFTSGTTDAKATNNAKLISGGDVIDLINSNNEVIKAMHFQGVLEPGTNGVYALPTSPQKGDVWVLKGPGTFNSEAVTSGDTVIYTGSGWAILQDNVEALSTVAINGTGHGFYTSGLISGLTLFAPTGAGTSGELLVSTGGTPEWAAPATIKVGSATSADTAGQVANALSAGTGLSYGDNVTFDGSVARTISLINAGTSTIGGVKVAAVPVSTAQVTLTTPATSGNVNTISLDSGNIYLTAQNIVNALGYIPGNASNGIASFAFKSKTSGKYGDVNATSGTSNPYLVVNAGQDLGVQFIGSNGISISTKSSANVTVDLALATSGTRGGIKIGYSTPTSTPLNLPVALDSEKAYVALTNAGVMSVLSTFSDKANGLVPMNSSDNTGTAATNTTTLLGSDGKWHTLPANAFLNTWRDVLVGTASIGDVTLKFVNQASSVQFVQDTTDKGKLSVGLYWYDYSTNTIESGQGTL